MDPVLPILSILGYMASILGTLEIQVHFSYHLAIHGKSYVFLNNGNLM